MAFGGLRGTFTGNGPNTGTTNSITGSVVISVGDLVFVVFGEQTALTASGVTDNLGNTYTAQNAGTDAGAATGRAFYSIVTVAGTLTTLTAAATSSTDDWAGVGAVIEGPFWATSALDANPANISNDITSPFTCPATGTLSQASEVIMAWAAADTSATWSATSPNTLAVQVSNSTNIKAVIGYQTVSATSTVSPAFTAASNPSVSVLGTASFKQSIPVSVSVTGLAGTSALGLESVVASASVPETGVTGTSALGNGTVVAKASTSVTGVSATGQVGDVTVVAKANVTTTGVLATSALGNVSLINAVSVDVSGVTATGFVGSVSVVVPVSVAVTGFEAATSLGSVSVIANAAIQVTGVFATSALGSVSVSCGVSLPVSGFEATGQTGDATVSAAATGYVQSFDVSAVATALLQAATNSNPGKALFKDVVISGRMLGDIDNTGTITSLDALAYLRWGDGRNFNPSHVTYIETVLNPYMTQNPAAYAAYLSFGYGDAGTVTTANGISVSVSGVSASGQVGDAYVALPVNVSVSGVAGTTALGTVTVQLGTPAIFDVIGVSATSYLGNVSVAIPAVVPVTGVYGTASVGSVTVVGTASVFVSNVTGNTFLGSVTASAGAVIDVSGIAGTTALGSVTAIVSINALVSGVDATGYTGGVTVNTGCSLFPAGIYGTGAVGKVFVWGQVDDDQPGAWTPIQVNEAPTWHRVGV